MPHPRAGVPIWVRYEAKSNLVSLMALSLAAEVAHRRLPDSVWATGRWPVAAAAATQNIARATPKAWPAIFRELRTIGWHTHGARLVNHDVAGVLAEARASQAARSAMSKSAADARWHRPESQPPPEACPPAQRPLPLPSHAPAPATAERIPVAVPDTTPVFTAREVPVQDSNSTVHNALNDAERLPRSGSPRKDSASLEKDFMEDVKATMEGFSPKFASAELENWGGWWRNRFRESPDKARRVLAEIHSMVKERRIQTNPGAAATDLWSRLP